MGESDEAKRARILHRLERLRPLINACDEKGRSLYAEREALFLEGRAMVPPMIQREMAEASGVTEGAVIHVVQRWHRRAAERTQTVT